MTPLDTLHAEIVTARARQLQARAHTADGFARGQEDVKLATRWLDVLLERLWALLPPRQRAEIDARPVRCEHVQGLR